MAFFVFISGGVSIVATLEIISLSAYLFLGGLGVLFFYIGIKLFQQIKFQDQYESFGIDGEKGVFWRAKMQAGKSDPIEILEIPFAQATTILLAPFEYTQQVQRANVYHYYYYDRPYVLLVYEKDRERHLLVISFKTNDDANRWLQASKETECTLSD
jgi:hypothetical protein